MNEILNNYKLFAVVFITILFMGVLIYKFLFTVEKREVEDGSFNIKYKKENKNLTPMEHDEKIFQKFNKLLPPVGGTVFFLRNNDMTMVFNKRELNGLYSFYEGCKSKEYAFMDKELEELKTDFYLVVEKYLLTFESNSKETSSGYYRVTYNIDRLHLLIDELVTKYDKLSTASQRKLFTDI